MKLFVFVCPSVLQAEEPCALLKQESSAIHPAVQPVEGCSLLDRADDFTRAGSSANLSHSVLFFPPQQRLLCLLSCLLRSAATPPSSSPFAAHTLQVKTGVPGSPHFRLRNRFPVLPLCKSILQIILRSAPCVRLKVGFPSSLHIYILSSQILALSMLPRRSADPMIAGTHVPIQNLKGSNKKHEEQWLSSRKVSLAVSRHLSGTQWAFSTGDIQCLLAIAYAKRGTGIRQPTNRSDGI